MLHDLKPCVETSSSISVFGSDKLVWREAGFHYTDGEEELRALVWKIQRFPSLKSRISLKWCLLYIRFNQGEVLYQPKVTRQLSHLQSLLNGKRKPYLNLYTLYYTLWIISFEKKSGGWQFFFLDFFVSSFAAPSATTTVVIKIDQTGTQKNPNSDALCMTCFSCINSRCHFTSRVVSQSRCYAWKASQSYKLYCEGGFSVLRAPVKEFNLDQAQK